MHESGLHILERPDGDVSGRVFIQTVEGNRMLYTKSQCARADKAGELYELLTYPGPRDFENIVRQGRIRDCTVTLDDVKRFFHIYGPHVMKGKGNAVRKVDKYEKNNIVAVPRELIKAQRDVVLSIDMFFVDKHVFLGTYSNKICYTTTSHVSSKAVRHYLPYLVEVLQKYAARGFRVTEIRGDFEFNGIEKQLKLLPSPPTTLWTRKDQHVGPIERNNRFIKEKTRSIRTSLPYAQIPGIMIIHMVLHALKVLNLFPRSGGIRDMSPNMIISDEGVSVQQFRLLVGTYVQVKEPSTQSNSMQPRTRGAIALGTRGSSNDGQIFMALDTGKVIRRTHWKVHPVTDLIRRRVEELGSDEPRLLTWFDRHGQEIGDGGMLWDSAQATAETDRDTRTVLDNIEESPESDLEDDADDVDNEDITGVDPHNDEDVEESLDEYNQDFEDGDVNEQTIEENTVKILDELSSRVNDYISYIAEEWLKENRLVVESGIKTEIAENFLDGMRNIFEQNYIQVPEEKVDLVSEIEEENDELRNEINDQVNENIELRKEIVALRCDDIFESHCDGLADTQVEKLRTLAEGIEFDSEELFEEKLSVLKESYFGNARRIRKPASASMNLVEEIILDSGDTEENLQEQETSFNPIMQNYASALSRKGLTSR